MKRFFFLSIALAAVAVGCTKSGLLESPQTYQTPISFEPYTGKAPVTKATVAVDTTIYGSATEGGFRVIGFEEIGDDKHFDTTGTSGFFLNKRVYAKDNAPTWTYDETMYWPEAKTISFVSYGLNVNADDDIFSLVYEDASLTKYNFTVPQTVAEQKDLLISPIMKGKHSGSGTIGVRFFHVLSRVGFKVKPSGTADVNVMIKSIKLTGSFVQSGMFDLTNAVDTTKNPVEYNYKEVAASGDVTYDLFGKNYSEGNSATKYPCFLTVSEETPTAVPVWNNTNFSTATEPGDLTPPAMGTDGLPTTDDLKKAYADRYMMIMPQTVSGAEVEVVYHLEDAVEQTTTIPLGDFTFEAGKAYEFVFTLSTTAVGFDVEVGTWDTSTGDIETNLTPIQ